MKKLFLFALLWIGALAHGATELQRLYGARLVEWPGNDGDSFKILYDGKEQIIRLYYVDCPETFVRTEGDARRVREQTRHFGLADTARTIFYGKEAAAFTRAQLAQPFTVYTCYTDALGRSAGGRVYGFVITTDGRDLAELLIENGYARAYGFRRALPDGTRQEDAAAKLTDKETAAGFQRKGIWSETDPDRLVELRAETRQEEADLKAIVSPASAEKININTATAEELQRIRGVGKVTAQRIIAARPLRGPDDLDRIPRLPASTRSNIVEHAIWK